jgi:hypothetical protein
MKEIQNITNWYLEIFAGKNSFLGDSAQFRVTDTKKKHPLVQIKVFPNIPTNKKN